MGFLDTTTDAQIPVFYNVYMAVGVNSPNRSDDVKLVQYLLMAVYAKAAPSAKPSGAIAVTGFCGPATVSWIQKFQKDVNSKYAGCLLLDSRVDRALNHNTTGSVSNTVYTILALNRIAMLNNPAAWLAAPQAVTLGNPSDVPSPYLPQIVPASGGS